MRLFVINLREKPKTYWVLETLRIKVAVVKTEAEQRSCMLIWNTGTTVPTFRGVATHFWLGGTRISAVSFGSDQWNGMRFYVTDKYVNWLRSV